MHFKPLIYKVFSTYITLETIRFADKVMKLVMDFYRNGFA